MPETGDHAMAVIDNNNITVKALFTGIGYNAIGSGQDGRSGTSGNIIGFMKFASTGKGRFAIAKFGCHPGLYAPGNRADGRRGGQQILLVFKGLQQGFKLTMLAAGSTAELLDLLMHISHQTVMLFLEGDLGIEVFGNGTTHTKNIARIVGFFNIGDDANLFLKIVQCHQLGFQRVDFGRKFLNLFALEANFLHLAGKVDFSILELRSCFSQMVVIVHDVTYNNEKREKGNPKQTNHSFGSADLLGRRTAAAEDDK